MMSNLSTRLRILFVTPEAVFMPGGESSRANVIGASADGFGHFPVALISDLFHLGVDVYVAQPDYRRIFAVSDRNEQANSGIKLPIDRVQLAEDRVFFYSQPTHSNSEWENIKISLAFQREVINQIIPRVQPALIHCYDWMTGLIPAAAKKNEIPCLFTVQQSDTARSLLSCVEDIGIDAAGFWQNLFYDSYPDSYEQTRDTNPLDLLLSGILAASHVNTAGPVLLGLAEGSSDFMYSSLGQLLAQRWNAGCASRSPVSAHPRFNPTIQKKSHCSCGSDDQSAGKQKNDRARRQSISSPDNRATAQYFIDLYETICQRPLVTLEKKKVRPINKNNRTETSILRAIPYPKARSTKRNSLPNERVSTPAAASI